MESIPRIPWMNPGLGFSFCKVGIVGRIPVFAPLLLPLLQLWKFPQISQILVASHSLSQGNFEAAEAASHILLQHRDGHSPWIIPGVFVSLFPSHPFPNPVTSLPAAAAFPPISSCFVLTDPDLGQSFHFLMKFLP